MTKESLTAFLIGPVGLPLGIGLAIYACYTYRRKTLALKNGRELSAEEAPFGFWANVLGTLGLALFLSVSGSVWLWRYYFG